MDGQAQACLVEGEGAAAVVGVVEEEQHAQQQQEQEGGKEEEEEETASAAAAQSDALCPRGNPTLYSCSSQRACSSSVGKLSRQRLPG